MLCSECNSFVRRIVPAMVARRSSNRTEVREESAHSTVVSDLPTQIGTSCVVQHGSPEDGYGSMSSPCRFHLFRDTRIETGDLFMAKDSVSYDEIGSSREHADLGGASDSSTKVPVPDSRPTRSTSACISSLDDGYDCGMLVEMDRPSWSFHKGCSGDKSVSAKPGKSENAETSCGSHLMHCVSGATNSSHLDICQFERVQKRNSGFKDFPWFSECSASS